MTIVELDLPSTAGGQTNTESNFRVEVIVREEGIVISNGTGTIATIPNLDDDEYDLDTLSEYIVELKREYPDHEEASVLMESHIPYDYLIQVMDIVRSIEVPTDIEEEVELVALFTEISVGDAP
jgi:biopolymer transport protein ExbD